MDSNTQLNAIATDLTSETPVPGTFVYTDEAGNVVTTTTVLSAGTHTLTATFTPTYSASYASGGTATAQFTVNKATPTLTWTPSPTTITYGTALVAGQLNAQSSASGTFVYTDEARNVVTTTTVLSAGTHTLTATFKSIDPNYASGGTATAQFTVNKATPTLIWPNPADIPYETPLSSIQLDATAINTISGHTVSGTFAYIPPSGTVLPLGQHQLLSVSFTPTNAVDYTTATGTAYINIIPTNVQNSALTLVKLAHPISYDSVGQTITYTYTVKNAGTGGIDAPINITDDKFGTMIIKSSGTLSPGSSVPWTVNYKTTDSDTDKGSVSNLATATGLVNGNNVTSNNAVGVVLYEHPKEHSHY